MAVKSPARSGVFLPCVAENRTDWSSVPMMNPTFGRLPGAKRSPGSKCNVRGSSWLALRANGQRLSPINSNAMRPRSGGPAYDIEPMAWLGCSPTAAKNTRGDRPRFPPLQRAQIVALACLEPVARGLHITHWSREDLASQAVADGIVPTISARTIGRILDAVDLQPHRTRYWRTSRLDARFKERAEKVLWCYAASRAAGPARDLGGVRRRDAQPPSPGTGPIRRGIPGSIEQQEFDYIRHGTVNILNFLVVHTGEMEAVCLEANDADHYVPSLDAVPKEPPSPSGDLPGP